MDMHRYKNTYMLDLTELDLFIGSMLQKVMGILLVYTTRPQTSSLVPLKLYLSHVFGLNLSVSSSGCSNLGFPVQSAVSHPEF